MWRTDDRGGVLSCLPQLIMEISVEWFEIPLCWNGATLRPRFLAPLRRQRRFAWFPPRHHDRGFVARSRGEINCFAGAATVGQLGDKTQGQAGLALQPIVKDEDISRFVVFCGPDNCRLAHSAAQCCPAKLALPALRRDVDTLMQPRLYWSPLCKYCGSLSNITITGKNISTCWYLRISLRIFLKILFVNLANENKVK